MATTTNDTTAHKKAEQEIRQQAQFIRAVTDSKEKYRILFDSIAEGLIIFGIIRDDARALIDLRYQALNQAMQQQTGLDARTILGRRLAEVLPKADWERWMPMLTQVLASGEPVTFEEFMALIDRWYMVSFYPRSGDELASFYRSITDRKRQERQQQYLVTLSDALGDTSDPIHIEKKLTAVT